MLLKRFQRIILCIIIFISICLCSTTESYAGMVPDTEHGWLRGKKIFLDPGHGGNAAHDPFRTGPFCITEESVNLRVGLILRDMLVQAGAFVTMSRITDIFFLISISGSDFVCYFRPGKSLFRQFCNPEHQNCRNDQK